MSWSTDGMFGTFDRAAVQRGFQVYQEVCSACHGVKLRGLPQPRRRSGYTEDEIKAIAAQTTVNDGPNDEGEMFDRPGLPFDHMHGPVRRTSRRPRRPMAAGRRRTCR